MEKGVTPLCGSRRVENVNYLLRRYYPEPATSSVRRCEPPWPRVRNMRPTVWPSPRILHSSPVEEKKLGFPLFENGPSAIQGEGATSTFSGLREWEERGVTTPNVLKMSHLKVHTTHEMSSHFHCRCRSEELKTSINIPYQCLLKFINKTDSRVRVKAFSKLLDHRIDMDVIAIHRPWCLRVLWFILFHLAT